MPPAAARSCMKLLTGQRAVCSRSVRAPQDGHHSTAKPSVSSTPRSCSGVCRVQVWRARWLRLNGVRPERPESGLAATEGGGEHFGPQWCPARKTGISLRPEQRREVVVRPQWCPARKTGISPPTTQGRRIQASPQWCPARKTGISRGEPMRGTLMDTASMVSGQKDRNQFRCRFDFSFEVTASMVSGQKDRNQYPL